MSEGQDWINHPEHYTRGKYEHVIVVEDWKLGYHLGNATKYLMRAGHKDDGSKNLKSKTIEDLKKANWYTVRASEHVELACGAEVLAHSPNISLYEILDDWCGDGPMRLAMFDIFSSVQWIRIRMGFSLTQLSEESSTRLKNASGSILHYIKKLEDE